jgi:hypothetical protein
MRGDSVDGFFVSVMDDVHRFLGNLFFRGASPSELVDMPYHELKYWNQWHEVMADEERRSVSNAKAKGK